MKNSLKHIILEIHRKEDKLALQNKKLIDEAYEMTTYLQNLLSSVKEFVTNDGFETDAEEINFFRNIKPQILGKLIYYNKVYRIETSCPVNNGKLYDNYFSTQLAQLKREYIEYICNSDFYRYYRSGRTDRDTIYFKRGNINYHDGLNSIVFEMDPSFSTFFDYKTARIIANELIYTYLLTKINPAEDPDMIFQKTENSKDIFWTESKNSLVELIYALHASGAISHGKIGIRKISLLFQIIFRVNLGDLHHSFHRMKTRAGSRTAFLDQIKISLEEYMDKDL